MYLNPGVTLVEWFPAQLVNGLELLLLGYTLCYFYMKWEEY
nr:hypothetical protein [Neobacillus sp. 179.-C4.2 HS]